MQTTATTKKERPILFSGEMIRAILEGRKTQTRRVAKPFNPPEFYADAVHQIAPAEFIAWHGKPHFGVEFTKSVYRPGDGHICPYGKPGDRLWVRETWREADSIIGDCALNPAVCFAYKADSTIWDVRGQQYDTFGLDFERFTWKPSIFMPRAASRILLEITDVRVERLQEISEEDAISEGVASFRPVPGDRDPETLFANYLNKRRFSYRMAYYSFASLWQSINGPESWEANPWVWAITFQRIKP